MCLKCTFNTNRNNQHSKKILRFFRFDVPQRQALMGGGTALICVIIFVK